MGTDAGLIPTQPISDSEYQRWSAVYAGDQYYYGSEPGPVARRAVRYHRQYRPRGGTALDAGCGEGQDLAFLAERGYVATGVEFTSSGAAKAVRLLQSRGLEGEVVCQDLQSYAPPHRFDLVLAINSVQFLGPDGGECLRKLVASVADGGVCGISIFAHRRPRLAAGDRPVEPLASMWLLSLEELMAYFPGWQMLEAAQVWQWNPHTNQPQPFATLVCRKVPAQGPALPLP
jgi:SAM-dependent methyltransferase